jgi:DNA polymerase
MATVMEGCSSALRGVIVAPPGKKLVVADLSNIEGRVLAWLAGENWKVKAFRDYDNKIGHDLYKLTYAKAFGVPVEKVGGELRQIGKVMELAFGYGGGVGAWIIFAASFGLDLEAMAEAAYDNIPDHIIHEAEGFQEWWIKQKKSTYSLSSKAFIVCDSFKRMWREEHANVETYWKQLEAACILATKSPGQRTTVGKHKILRKGAWLRITLPSGRCLCYPKPRVGEDGKLSYMGTNQFTRKWCRLNTYGGKLAENITQATARDVLAYKMHEIEEHGFEISLTVHDEIIAEAPDSPDFTAAQLSAIMSTPSSWCLDLPLDAKGFETYRYCKPD